MRAPWLLIPFLLLSACGEPTGGNPVDDTGDGARELALEILSPSDGATFMEGTAVALEVRAVDQATGDAVTLDTATWTSGMDWSFSGTSGSVTDLPAGPLVLTATATVDGESLTDSVSITVEAQPMDYSGSIASTVTVESEWADDSGPCDGPVTIHIDGASEVTGSGSCHVDLFWGTFEMDVNFTIEGQRTGQSVAGLLVITGDQGERYETPFTGTATDLAFDASFDQSWESEDGRLTLAGTLHGLAQ